MKKTFCFAKDDDGHTYLISRSKRERFDTLMESSYENDNFDEFEKEFGQFRIGTNFTNYEFSDPKEIE